MMHLGTLLDLMKRQDFLNRLLWELRELIKVKIFKLPQKEQVLKAMLVIIIVISQEPVLDTGIHLCRNTDRQSQQKQIYSVLHFGPWPLHHPSFPLHKRRASQIWLHREITWGRFFKCWHCTVSQTDRQTDRLTQRERERESFKRPGIGP